MARSFAVRGMRGFADDSQSDAQLNLVHEDIFEALKSLVAAMGGAKKVGPRLYPQKTESAARQQLHDCLNTDRDHELGVQRLFTLLKWGREAGAHIALYWLCDELGYTRPQPIEPEDQAAEILRRVDVAKEELRTCLQQLDKLPRSGR